MKTNQTSLDSTCSLEPNSSEELISSEAPVGTGENSVTVTKEGMEVMDIILTVVVIVTSDLGSWRTLVEGLLGLSRTLARI